MAVDHPHAPVIDAERLGADLRHRRLEPLAERRAAGYHLDVAVGVDGDPRPVGGAAPALLDEHADAGADQLAVRPAAIQFDPQRLPAEGRRRLVQQAGIVAGIQHHVRHVGLVEGDGVGHLVRRDQVALPHLDGVDPQLRGDGVHQPFAHEGALVSAGRAIGGARRLVGQAEMTDGPERGNAVGSGYRAHGPVGDVRAVGADITALVVEEFVVDAEYAPTGVDGDARQVVLFAPLVGAHQVLLAVLDPLHRPAEPHGRDQDEDILGVKLATDAEAAADMAFVHMHPGRVAPEHADQRFLVAVRHLGGAVELQHILRRVVAADGAPRLHRHAGMPAGPEVERNHALGIGESGVDFAVAVVHDGRLGAAAGCEFPRRVIGRDDDRQLLDLDNDRLGRVLGQIGILREHRGHRVADIAHAPLGQHRLAVGFEPLRRPVGAEIDRPDVGDVLGGPDGDDARHRPCLGCVDGDDLPMGVGRAHHAHVELAGKGDVGDEAGSAGDQRRVLEALYRPPQICRLVRRHQRRLICAAAARTALTMLA